MRTNDGGLDAQGPDPDDYYSIDFTEFDSAMEGSLKHLDLSFSVSDESDDDHDAETAAAWVRYPRLMLKSLEFRLNEILKICEAKKFPNTVIQLKPEYIFTDEEKKYPVRSGRKLVRLLGISFVLRHCGKLVDTVNSIKATPFSGDLLTELVKCIGRGDTPEFDRSIRGYKGALGALADWIRTKEIYDGKVPSYPSIAPLSVWSFIDQTLAGKMRIETINFYPMVAGPTATVDEIDHKPPTEIDQLVSPEEVSMKLKSKGIKKSAKTLKNTWKAQWGKPDGCEGNAELFNWNRIRPIVEDQFGVKFDD